MPTVEIAWAGPAEQILLRLGVPDGTTLEGAVQASGVLRRLGTAAPDPLVLGVFGRLRPGTDEVREGDRIELYRPLVADPKESRRKRATTARAGRPRRG